MEGVIMSEFVENLPAVFATFGPVQARRMFGGHGVYHEGLMFGLVADGALYLKADTQTVQAFESRGLEPFIYVKDGKPMKMSYYLAPEEIYDDLDSAREWAMLAFGAATRAKQVAGKKKPPRAKPVTR
jgi:DNA transformation protein